jgi:hypothetical protein
VDTVRWNSGVPGGLVGGLMTFEAVETSSGDRAYFPLYVRGENPQESTVRSQIAAPWYADNICFHESGYNQFIGGYPLFGEPDGWGLFQLDSSRGSPISLAEKWSWQANVQGGMSAIGECITKMNTWYNSLKRTYPSASEPPGSFSYEYESTGYTITISDGKDACAIQAYNGLSTSQMLENIYGELVETSTCWVYDGDNDTFSFVPNVHNYVYKVVYRIQD